MNPRSRQKAQANNHKASCLLSQIFIPAYSGPGTVLGAEGSLVWEAQSLPRWAQWLCWDIAGAIQEKKVVTDLGVAESFLESFLEWSVWS